MEGQRQKAPEKVVDKIQDSLLYPGRPHNPERVQETEDAGDRGRAMFPRSCPSSEGVIITRHGWEMRKRA